MTEDDKMIAVRRTVTCLNRRPFVFELGNDYCEQFWFGDITDWPGYQEFDKDFKS